MRHVHLIALACGLVVALIAVLLLAGGGAAGAPSPVAAATRERPRSTAAPSVESLASDAADAQAQRAAAAGSGEQLLSASTLAVGPRGVQILPVMGAGRRTVEPVELWWWPEDGGDSSADNASFSGLLQECRMDAALSARAQRIAADEQGRFFAPAPKAEGVVIARSSELWGYASLDAQSDDPTYVVCEPDATLQVRVIDGGGAAVEGVRVALRQHYHGQFFHDHGVALTDAQGLARLPHYRALIDGDWDFSARYSIAIAEPLSAEVARLIDVTAPPTELVELVLPPVGSVEVEFEGASAHLRAGLELLEFGATPPEDHDERFADGRRDLSAARVRFPFVGVGRELVPWSFQSGEQRPHDEARRLGPVRAGDEVRLRVRLLVPEQASTTRLTGRVINQAGDALAQVRLRVSIQCEGGDDTTYQVIGSRSDAAGRFSVPCSLPCDVPVQVRLNGEHSDGRSFATVGRGVAVPLDASAFELGDLRVVESTLLAAGKVVERAGAPVPRAEVDVFERVDHVRANGESWVEWRTHARGVRADEHGAFTFWGEAVGGRVWLQARSRARRSNLTRVERGQSDVVLVLERDGAIAGRVLLPPLAPTDFVYVTATSRIRNFHALAPDEDWNARLDTNGEFLLAGLPPDEYEINVYHDGRDAALETIERVVVKEHATTRDARLDPLDLRGLDELFVVEIFAPEGRPLGAVNELEHGESADDAWENEHTGHRLILHRDGPPLWIVADGCAFQELIPASTPARITLQRAPRVRVRLDEALAPLPEELEIGVAITSPGEPAWLSEFYADELHFGAARVGVGTLRRVGALKATLWLYGEDSIALPAQFLGAARVVAVSAQQELVITCDPAQLAEALEELR